MKFLKKASYNDIVGNKYESKFYYCEELSEQYKEFELFLTKKHLYELLDIKSNLQNLNKILKKNGAVIAAIHCPESNTKTCNERASEISSNYLSLCEVLRSEESQKIFKNVLRLADKICHCQQETQNDADIYYDQNETDTYKPNDKHIIVILHEGCEKGCIDNNLMEEINCNISAENVADMIKNLIKDLDIRSSIQIALENITPFYSTTNYSINTGNNCGWKHDNQTSKTKFFEDTNNALKGTKIQFGSCIDFCHIMVSSKIMNEQKSKSETIDEYFKKVDYKKYICLFHVSNYGEDLSHGKLFYFENEEDKKAIETIKNICSQYAPKAPITFEMADGMYLKRAAVTYEHMMLWFSNKHLFGKFGELLNVKVNEELKDFFDMLFVIYSYDKKCVFEITNALWRVKQIILKNTFDQYKEEVLFGVDFDKTKVNLALVRLKAYVYYTRFCNLGNYLADNYYSGNECIWNSKNDNEHDIANDFGLAMKYFIFNDKVHQCVYTGIRYRFLIDFLPKKKSYVRFNDGIEHVHDMKLDNIDPFGTIVKKILNHINGTSIGHGEADFYSVGINFVKCLFKYFNSSHKDWSVKVYENMPVNYVDYNNKRYSIQAFTQLVLSNKNFINRGEKIDLSLDISRFASGRTGTSTDTLEGFIQKVSRLDTSFSRVKVASISEGEILFTKLPSECTSYTFNAIEGVILKKIYLEIIKRNEDESIPIKIELTENNKNTEGVKRLKEVINKINNNKTHSIWNIINKIKNTIYTSRMSTMTIADLEDLNTYTGTDKTEYDRLENLFRIKIGEE